MEQTDNIARNAIKSATKKYRTRIWTPFISAVKSYRLIEEGDRIAVCMSGGKDSALLAVLMKNLEAHSEIPFSCRYIAMDPGYSEENLRRLRDNCEMLEIPVHIFSSNIFRVTEKISGDSPCYLCARMRRGYLYNEAKELGCNKIALGHHMSDVIETTLMGMLWGAQIQGMLPKIRSTNFEGMELIRPLYKVLEDDIISWSGYNGLEFLGCACSLTAGNATGDSSSKRLETKKLIKELKKSNPDIERNLFKSIHNVKVDTLAGYKINGVEHSFLDSFENLEEDCL